MTLTGTNHDPRRRASPHWLALSFCALGILMAAFFNLGASAALDPDPAELPDVFLTSPGAGL